MSVVRSAFNWRGFWADLLRGTGRGLLALDGSREAEAALSGLDYFDAAQRRRRLAGEHLDGDWEEEAQPSRARNPGSVDVGGEGPTASYGRRPPAPPRGHEEGFRDEEYDSGRPTYGRSFAAKQGLPPSVRPRALSADPYEEGGRPIPMAQQQYRRLIRR